MGSLRLLFTLLVTVSVLLLSLTQTVATAADEPPASQIPLIETPPVSQTVVAGTASTLFVATNSLDYWPDIFAFQWYRDGRALPGKTNSWLEFDAVQFTDAGLYRVVVSSPAGSVVSPAARLTVTVPPPSAPEFPAPLRVGEGVSTSITVPGPALAGLVYKTRGLPAGLRLDPETGDLGGSIHVAGSHRFTYWAQYRSLKSIATTVTMTVEPFPEQYVGAYEVLLDGPNYAPGGKVSLRVSPTGVFTGTLRATALASALPIKGRLGFFTEENAAWGRLTLPPGRDKAVRELEVSVEANKASAALLIGGSHVTSGTQGPRLKPYSPGAVEPAAGRYTLAFASPENLGNTSAPEGAGYATATISSTGLLKLTGRLPDGTRLTGTAPQLENGSYLAFSKPQARAGSGLGGVLQLETDDEESTAYRARERFYWVRPASPGKLYPESFGAVRFAVAMEKWTPPSTAVSLSERLGYPDSAPINVRYPYAPWSDEMPTTLMIDAKGNFVAADDNSPSGFTISLNPQTGVFSGKIRASNGEGGFYKVVFQGVLLQLPEWETEFSLAQSYYLYSPVWDPSIIYSARIEFGSF